MKKEAINGLFPSIFHGERNELREKYGLGLILIPRGSNLAAPIQSHTESGAAHTSSTSLAKRKTTFLGSSKLSNFIVSSAEVDWPLSDTTAPAPNVG